MSRREPNGKLIPMLILVFIRFMPRNCGDTLKNWLSLPIKKLNPRGCTFIIQPKLEPYVKFNQGEWNLPPRKVSAGYVYVVGDNRGMPIEQHKFGQIRKSRIQGTLLL